MSIPVVVGKRFDPALARTVEHPEGATLGEIVRLEFSDVSNAQLQALEVRLVNKFGEIIVPYANWRLVRPRAGTTVIVRARLARGDVLRTILSIVILISAAFLGPMVAGFLGFSATSIVALAASAVITIGGNLLLGALLPAPKNRNDKRAERYSLTGGRNQMAPWGTVPDIKGKCRITPPLTCEPYTFSEGDDQKLRMQFLMGYAPLELTDFKIGETTLADFKGVQLITRTVEPGGPIHGVYPEPVFQENINVELKQTTKWTTGDNWQRQVTASYIAEIELDYTFPRGLVVFTSQGRRQAYSVEIACRWRKKGDTVWTYRPPLTFTEASVEPLRRSDRWAVPAVGQYEVEVRRVTADNDNTQISDQVVWTAWRGFRPVRTIRMSKPVVVCDLEILATGQLNGVVDQFNCVAHSIRPDYDAATDTWITRPTSNPASLYRDVLQGNATHLPRTNDQIDIPALQEWHSFCAAKGLEYNRAHAAAEGLDEVLANIASAGRAMSSRHFGIHSIVIDRPQTVIRGLITPRNAHSFAGEISYRDVEDALRVKFLDRSNGWAQTERIVKRPGLAGEPQSFFEIEFPGITDAAQAYRAALRWFYERLLRYETFWATQDYEALFAPIGSLVMLTFPILSEQRTEARVAAVSGTSIMLDRDVTMDASESYGIRVRSAGNSHFVRTVATVQGETNSLELTGSGLTPSPGDLVVFGLSGDEATEAIVKSVESQKDLSARLTLVRHAPEIEANVDGAIVPAWVPLIPDDRPYATTAPAAPAIVRVYSGTAALSSQSATPPVTVIVAPGPGNLPGLATYTVTANDQISTVAAATGRATFEFAAGTTLTISAKATSVTGIDGPSSLSVSHVVEARNDLPPAIAQFSVIRLATGQRQYSWSLDPAATPAQTADIAGFKTAWRAGSGWAWTDLSPMHTGLMTMSPVESYQPVGQGVHTLGIVAVDHDGQEGPPHLITETLGPAYGGTTFQRIESALAWPGTLTNGARSQTGGLIGLPNATLIYESPIIDLGSDLERDVQPARYGVVGTATITIQKGTSAQGAPVGDFVGPGLMTARYLKIRISITHPSVDPALDDLVLIL